MRPAQPYIIKHLPTSNPSENTPRLYRFYRLLQPPQTHSNKSEPYPTPPSTETTPSPNNTSPQVHPIVHDPQCTLSTFKTKETATTISVSRSTLTNNFSHATTQMLSPHRYTQYTVVARVTPLDDVQTVSHQTTRLSSQIFCPSAVVAGTCCHFKRYNISNYLMSLPITLHSTIYSTI
jgi:hypothetical protein